MADDNSVEGGRSPCIGDAAAFTVEERVTNCSRDADQQLGGGMKILVSFPHALGSPGIGWTAWNQVNELVRRGHDVTVVAASVANPVAGATLVQSLSVAGRRIPHRSIGRDRAFAWHDRVAQRTYEKVRPELVHLWPLAPGLTAAAASSDGTAVVREAPNTHTVHAWRVVEEEVRSLGLDGAISTAHTADAAHLRMEQAEWDAATGVLAPSTVVAESFVAEGFPAERIFRHQYGYTPGTRRIEARGADDRPLRAIYVGLGEPRKGLHYALRAWLDSDASRDGTFTIVGRILPAYRDLLAGELAHPSIRAVGFSSSVGAALAASDVLLLPTIEEGSALVTYEAQGAGCVPLVSSAAGAMLDDGVQGLIHEPRDVATLTGHLDLLSEDRARLAALSRAALAHAPELTWEAAGARLEGAYEVALAVAGSTAPTRLAKGGVDAVSV